MAIKFDNERVKKREREREPFLVFVHILKYSQHLNINERRIEGNDGFGWLHANV